MEEKERGRICLKDISQLYAEATDKNISVRQIRGELEGLGYTVKLNDGEHALKNWALKQEDKQDLVIDGLNINFVEI